MKKTLKEIAETAYFEMLKPEMTPEERVNVLDRAILEYAKSICPEEACAGYYVIGGTCRTCGISCKQGENEYKRIGHNACRSQILTSISESEKELNQ